MKTTHLWSSICWGPSCGTRSVAPEQCTANTEDITCRSCIRFLRWWSKLDNLEAAIRQFETTHGPLE